jgi:hypothetical protein
MTNPEIQELMVRVGLFARELYAERKETADEDRRAVLGIAAEAGSEFFYALDKLYTGGP